MSIWDIFTKKEKTPHPFEELIEENKTLRTLLEIERTYRREANGKNEELSARINELDKRLLECIPMNEHNRILHLVREDYERRVTEIKKHPVRVHNERGAGRKRIASKGIISRVHELHGKGLSQAKIASLLADEDGVKISRTVVGEIIRGEYIQFDKK